MSYVLKILGALVFLTLCVTTLFTGVILLAIGIIHFYYAQFLDSALFIIVSIIFMLIEVLAPDILQHICHRTKERKKK